MSETSREIPKYECHKQVHALKIKDIQPDSEVIGGVVILPEDEGFAAFAVDAGYVNKHKPEVGGYYVVYQGGYKSFSPADVFEDGYTPI